MENVSTTVGGTSSKGIVGLGEDDGGVGRLHEELDGEGAWNIGQGV
jgi:hypothetical protein